MNDKTPPGFLSAPDPEDPFEVLADPLADSVRAHAQTRPVRGWPDHTLRDEANALTVFVFRNGFIEDLHAAGRITDPELKKLNIGISARLAHALYLRDWLRRARQKDWFALLEGFARFTRGWERKAIEFELPADERVTCACGRELPKQMWRFCPWCGREKLAT